MAVNDLENSKDFSPEKVRRELILYLLKEYGDLQTKDISKVLGYEERTIRRTLKELKEMGKVKGERLGKGHIWSSSEDDERLLYF